MSPQHRGILRISTAFPLELEGIDRIIAQAKTPEALARELLEAIRELFRADRAFLIHPVDPEAPYWTLAAETTDPRYPGAFAQHRRIPHSPARATMFHTLLAADGPVAFTPMPPEADSPAPIHARSLLGVALPVRFGRRWALGLHQCSHERHWSERERALLQAVANRVTDPLSAAFTLQELHESRQWMALALENSASMAWDLDLSQGLGTIDMVSAETFASGGARTRELTLKRWKTLLHPEDREEALARMQAHLSGETDHYESEHRIFTTDRGWIWLLSRGRVVERTADGKPVRMVGTAIDISARKRMDLAFHHVVKGTAAVTGPAFFRSLVQHLAEGLDTRFALVGTLTDPDRVHTLAMWADGKQIPPFDYDLEHTPCARVATNEVVWIPSGVRERYPLDTDLQAMGAESYLGIPLSDSHGRATGILVVVDTKPMPEGETAIGVLRIFASRAAAELERQTAEQALQEAKDKAEVTLHAIADGVIVTDSRGRISYLNPIAARLTGLDPKEAEGLPLDQAFQVVEENTRTPIPAPVDRCIAENRPVRLEHPSLLVGDAQGEHLVEASAAPIHNPAGEVRGAVLVFHDVTETRLLARRLQHQADHDPLTGLVNRREFERRLERLLGHCRGRHHALLYLDLDHFKRVNDTAGHLVGDDLLRRVAALLAAGIRSRDTLARLGGDEFGIILEDCSEERALDIGRALVQTLREHPFVWQGRPFDIGVSIGATPFGEQPRGLGELLSEADLACYTAKEMGRNRVYLYHAEDREARRRHADMGRATAIRQALAENRFVLFAQGVFPLEAASQPSHYELLLRIREPDGGLLQPEDFLPAAERFGLMADIDRWVIRHGLSSLNGHQGPQVAFNLSSVSLLEDDFMAFVREEIQRHGIAPQRLCFELGETAAVTHMQQAIHTVTALRELGCAFALDNFGAGLSSFRHLEALRVDWIKIDAGLIRDLADRAADRAMVAGIGQAGHTLGIRTIAKGAASARILDTLATLGVDYAQGYALQRPVSLETLLRSP